VKVSRSLVERRGIVDVHARQAHWAECCPRCATATGSLLSRFDQMHEAEEDGRRRYRQPAKARTIESLQHVAAEKRFLKGRADHKDDE